MVNLESPFVQEGAICCMRKVPHVALRDRQYSHLNLIYHQSKSIKNESKIIHNFLFFIYLHQYDALLYKNLRTV